MKRLYSFLFLICFCCVSAPAFADFGDEGGEEGDGYDWSNYVTDVNDDGTVNIWDFLSEAVSNVSVSDGGMTEFTFNPDGTVSQTFYSYDELINDPTLISLDWDQVSEAKFSQDLQYAVDNMDNDEQVQNDWKNVCHDPEAAATWLNSMFSEYGMSSDYSAFAEGGDFTVTIFGHGTPFLLHLDPNSVVDLPIDFPVAPPGTAPGNADMIDFSIPPDLQPEPIDLATQPADPYDLYDPEWAVWLQTSADPGGVPPIVPPVLEPSVSETTIDAGSTPNEFDATFNGIRNYVTPGGTPITLPVGTKIRQLKGLNYDYFPNGTLYEFVLPNGDKYAASLTRLSGPSGTIVPLPMFKGYYKVVNGSLDFNQPYNFTAQDYPAPDQKNQINVIRIRVQNDPCQLSQEEAVINMTNGVPGTVDNSGQVNVDDGISDALPAAGAPAPNTQSVNCADIDPEEPDVNTNMNMDQYVQSRGYQLAQFLRFNTQNKATIYFKDQSTGKIKYVVDQSGIKEPQDAEQAGIQNTFNTGNFSGSQTPVQIMVSVSGGKWSYEVKINTNSNDEHGNSFHIDPSVAGQLGGTEEAIRKEADAEVVQIKGVGSLNRPEVKVTETGEEFSKQSMDLLKALSAIYDVGVTVIHTGRMPEAIWDRGVRASETDMPAKEKYTNSPFHLPSVVGGGTDQLIQDVSGPVVLVTQGLEFIRHPVQSFEGVWNGVKSLDARKIQQIAASATGVANYQAGGDRATYQGGFHAMQFATVLVSGIGSIANKAESIVDGGVNMSEIEGFMPSGTQGSEVSSTVENALENNKTITNIDNEKLITDNVNGAEEDLVAVEKEADGTSKVYEVDESKLVDEDGNPFTREDIEEGARDVAMDVEVLGPNQYNTAAGQKGSWNKELNNPKPGSEYTVTNSTTPHKYATDASGRVTEASCDDLKLASRDRNGYQQSVKCNNVKDGVAGDQGGHLIGSRFDGAGEQINMVPMASSLNLSIWKTMENSWAAAIANGEKVSVKVESIYNGASSRPSSFKVTYTIGSEDPVVRSFLNQ